jgi:NAD(P)-dependent dehydrogenase (short-subunit alcohol dehydrogenase family)
MVERTTALIVGAGSGLSASLARLLAADGMSVVLAARGTEKLADLVAETGAKAIACDAADPAQVARLFEAVDAAPGPPGIVVYNPSRRFSGAITELDPEAVRDSLMVTAYGAFLVAQQAARRMLAAGRGTILLTGASAGVKGYPRSAPFAMGKFALRGLAQSLARELHPQNIHVAHIVIDGGIASERRQASADRPDSLLDPDAIARTYLELHRQHRSAWAWEIELRPWVEPF